MEKTNLRTKGADSQYQFDTMISDIGVSGLTFLMQKYSNDLKDYTLTHDLNDDENLGEYRRIKQRKKMLGEELTNRLYLLENDTLFSKDIHFNGNYDIVTKDDNGEIKVLRPSIDSNGNVEVIEIDEEDVRG